jgi:hypothetical protein
VKLQSLTIFTNVEINKLYLDKTGSKCGVMCLQAPPGRVASGEKIGVISFGTQQQQQHQYRSVHIYITIIVIISSSTSSSGGDGGSLMFHLLSCANNLGRNIFNYG